MKFEIKTKEVKEYIKKMSSLVPNFSALPHESGVLITVEETKIIFKSRNEYVSLKLVSNDLNEVKIIEIGSVLVKGKMLNEIISKMSGETIIFTKIDERILFVKSDDSEYEINLLCEENYENFDINYSVEEGFGFAADSKKFKNALQKVIPAVPEKHQRKILQGINIKSEGTKVFFTATNGTRIHRVNIELSQELNIDKTINIKSVKEILKVLSENKETNFKIGKEYLIIEDKEFTIKTRLIDGAYPDVSKPFNFDYPIELTIGKQNLLDLLERTTIMSTNQETGIVKMIINNGSLRFESREIEIGYSNVKTEEYEFNLDKRYEISFSPKFMFDAIKAVDNEELKIDFMEGEQPIKV
jgi:DNA polymerase-3 subunit beta